MLRAQSTLQDADALIATARYHSAVNRLYYAGFVTFCSDWLEASPPEPTS